VAVHSRYGRGMRLAFIISISLILALLTMASPAEAANRVALVIGAYENVPQLQKAVNDADAVAAELSKLGFDVVKAQDVGRRAMSPALVELEGKISPGDTALVYFAGHG
jgi:caspase domain-containing protein